MNKRVLHLIFAFLFLSTAAFSQAVTMSTATGGLAGAAQIGGSSGIAIIGVQLNKAAGGGNTVTTITVGMTPTPVGKLTNARLYESADATFAGIGSETFVTNGTISATDITFTAAPITSFDGATAAADDEYFFIVVDVDPAATGSTTPSIVAATGVLISTGTASGTTITGTTYNFTALEADFTQNVDDGTAFSDEDDVTLLDFTVNSNGTQSINSTLTFTFSTDVTNILENFDLQVGGVNIVGTETYPLTGGGTILTVTGFTSVDVTNATTFTLLADIKAGATSANDFTVSLVPAGINITPGIAEAFGTFSNIVDVTALEADFTQNGDDGTALSDEDDVTLLDFTVNSNGTQSINSTLTFTFSTDISNILENFDLQVAGINIGGSETYPLSGGGTILTVTGFNSVDVTNATTFTLLADIKTGATSANDFTVSLVPAGVNITPGIAEAFGTFSNIVDVTALEADFTQNADDATAFADQNGVELLDFHVNSTGTQTISSLVFTFNTNVTSILENWNLQVGSSNVPGAIYALNGPGTQLTINGFAGIDVTNSTHFQLFADIQAGATPSNDFTISLVPGGVTIAPGPVEAFGTFSNAIDIITSQASDIILVAGGTTTSIGYRGYQGSSIGPNQPAAFDPVASVSLADYTIRDGGGSADGDTKGMTVSAIQLQITNIQNVRTIALFNDDTDTELDGTETDVSSLSGTVTITFTPSTPISITDGGTFNFNVRASFRTLVTDNQPIQISIVSATASATGSGFSPVGSWASTQTANTENRIAVVASKFIFSSITPSTQSINAPITVTVQAVDQTGFQNVDVDYTGKVDLARTPGGGTFTAAQSFTGRNLVSGQFTWTNVQFSASNTYTLEVSDDAYTDPPDNQPNLGDRQNDITITATNSTITQPAALNLCYGGSFQTLGNIVITETDIAGFSSSGTFSIALPTGFVFDTGGSPPTLTMSNSTTTFSAQSFTGGNIFQFNYSIASPTGLNALTIGNLRIRYPGSTTPSGGVQITRSGGTAVMAGVGAGTQLGTVTAALGTPPAGGVNFTVVKVNAGDVDVDANETRFSQASNPVRLVGSQPTGVFSGPGVTFTSGQYRFNPASLSPGTYPIVYTFTDGTAGSCQFTAQKTFEVYLTSITGLALEYCNNAPASGVLSVSPATLSSICAGCVVYKYIYYHPGGGGALYLPGSNPASTVFDPKLPLYSSVYTATQASYGTYGIWLGFIASPDGGLTLYYNYAGLIPVRLAPTPTFTIADTDRKFCDDDPAVTLTGTPPNGDIVTDDYFTALVYPFAPTDLAPVGTVSASIPNPKVWSFDPGSLGIDSARITYTYRDPATGCTATSPYLKVTVNSRPGTVLAAAITSLGGTAPETCQGSPIGTFTATPLTSPDRYNWYSNAALTTNVGTGNSFAPPNPPVNPNTPTPVGSPHTFYITQTIDGCESNKQPVAPTAALPLTVTIKAAPPAPTPNFTDAAREFCVGATIDLATLVVPGTNVQWYAPSTTTPVLFSGTSPTLASLSIPNPTLGSATYDYEVSQTVSLCESPRTPVRVKIKSLPILSVLPSTDPLKICTEGGHDGGSTTLISFTGSDENGPVTTGSWVTAPATPTLPLGALIDGGGTALLNTPNLIPDNYTLRFTHTNSANCSNSIEIPLTVLPKVVTSILPLDSCFENFVRLNNTSTVQTGPSTSVPPTAANVVSTSWNFNDGNTLGAGSGSIVGVVNNGRTKGTYLSPQHNFANLGSKTVTFTMNTTYCSFTETKQITIHPKPQINFTWRNPCYDSVASRSTTLFTATETTTPSVPISQYYWNFNTENNLAHSGAPGGSIPTVNYTKLGADSVELIVETAAHCRDTIRKIVYVLPTYKTLTDSTGYDQTFNAGANFWLAGGVKSSWALGNTLAGSEASNGAAWATGLAGPNNDGEQSWVMSGCFNFSNAIKPVVSIDVWSDTPFGVDGTVFQYNEDGLIENDANWKVLGETGGGINWYDGSGISSSPGNQALNDYGWTGSYSGWKKAIYKLDDVKPVTPTAPDSLIVFRVAFGAGNRQQSGFAFDNVFIGERSRVVLLENFTNTSPEANSTPGQIAFNAVHNAKYDSTGKVSQGEIVKIQYHTAFPGDDALNKENQQMNNSRAAFYGITQSPAARLDGGYENGNLTAWLDDYNDDRVLTPSILNIEATAVPVGTDVRINVTLTNTGSQSLSMDGIHLFIVVVQTQINKAGNEELFGSSINNRFMYVAKQMLPNAAGIPLTGTLAGGSDYTGLSEIWSNPNGGDAIVIFVQRIDGENKNVLQAYTIENPPTPTMITGSEDPEYAKHINLYPNPANHELNIELPEAVNKPSPVVLHDAFGRVVYQAEFKAGQRTKKVSTDSFADGIYMMELLAPKGTKVTRKVMVKH